MEEIKIFSHLIISDIHNEYNIKWIGKVLDTKPKFKNGKPVFVIVGGGKRMELNTTDMTSIEHSAKRITCPQGRKAVATDIARIYIKEEDDSEKLLGVVTHNRVKTFSPMYDAVGYR